MALASGIGVLLRELRSMFYEHVKGQRCEELVCSWLEQKGWKILGRRVKSPYAEVDILASKFEGRNINETIKMIEVKSVSNRDYLFLRLSNRQRVRLHQALVYFSHKWKKDIELHIAFVDAKGSIEFFQLED